LEPVEGVAVVVLVGAARPQAELRGKVVVEAAVEFVILARRLAGQEIVVLDGERVGRRGIRLRQYFSRLRATGLMREVAIWFPAKGSRVPSGCVVSGS